MEEDNITEYPGVIELPVAAMKKAAGKKVSKMIMGAIAVYGVVEILARTIHLVPMYLIALEYISPFVILCGIVCAFINLYNGNIAAKKIVVKDDGLLINDDFFAFSSSPDLKFVTGKFFGRTRKFNSIYLDVRASGARRKYWLGHFYDKNAFAARDEISKVIDHLEFDEKLINQGN